MSLELEIRDARLKPDAILSKISRKFGFDLGIPKHFIKKNVMRTDSEVRYKGRPILNIDASCSLSISNRFPNPSYLYKYTGPVFDDEENFKIVRYRALVIENFKGCFGMGSEKYMTIRDENGARTAPEWFPLI